MSETRSSMKVDLKPGDALEFDNGKIRITLEQKSGQVARLVVQAERSVPISKQKLER